MKHRIHALAVTVILSMALVSCTGSTGQQEAVSVVSSEESTETSVPVTTVGKKTTYMSINVYKNGTPVGYMLSADEGEEQTVHAVLYREGDESETEGIGLLLVEDGELIPFSADGGEYSVMNYIKADPYVTKQVDITFKATPGFKVITLICLDHEDILLDTDVSYDMYNSDENDPDAFSRSNTDEYMVTMKEDDVFFMGFSEKEIDPANTKGAWMQLPPYYDDTMSAPVAVDDGGDAYVIFCSPADHFYYLLMLCDGKPIKAFDGKYTIYVDCEKGAKAFQYSIKDVLSPGRHNYSLLALQALPGKEVLDQSRYNSQKIPIEDRRKGE